MFASSLDDQEIRSFIFQNDAKKEKKLERAWVKHGEANRIRLKSILEKVNILKLNK